MNTQCCMLIGWEHNETRSRAKISSHTLRQGVSSNRNQSMMVSLHHHGNNNQLRHVNKWNLNECVHMWTLDGNSKQPFPTVNKTNIQLQLKTWQEDQVTLQKYLIHTWFKILFSIFIFNIHSFSFIFIHKIYVHNFGPIGPYSSTESASKWGKGPSHSPLQTRNVPSPSLHLTFILLPEHITCQQWEGHYMSQTSNANTLPGKGIIPYNVQTNNPTCEPTMERSWDLRTSSHVPWLPPDQSGRRTHNHPDGWLGHNVHITITNNFVPTPLTQRLLTLITYSQQKDTRWVSTLYVQGIPVVQSLSVTWASARNAHPHTPPTQHQNKVPTSHCSE